MTPQLQVMKKDMENLLNLLTKDQRTKHLLEVKITDEMTAILEKYNYIIPYPVNEKINISFFTSSFTNMLLIRKKKNGILTIRPTEISRCFNIK